MTNLGRILLTIELAKERFLARRCRGTGMCQADAHDPDKPACHGRCVRRIMRELRDV